MKKTFFVSLLISIVAAFSCSLEDSLLTSLTGNVSYDKFCKDNDLTCVSKNPDRTYPKVKEFSAALKVATAMGRYGSNGIRFVREDLSNANLVKAINTLGLQSDFAKMKDYVEKMDLSEIIIEKGIIKLVSGQTSKIENESGIIIERSSLITASISGETISIKGMKLGTNKFSPKSINSLTYLGNGELTIKAEDASITGVPLEMIFNELLPFFNLKNIPSFSKSLNAVPDIATWFFSSERETVISKEFFNVLKNEIPSLSSHPIALELAKIVSVIDQVEINEGSPFMVTTFDASKNLVCEMQAGATPKSYISFTEDYKAYDLMLERDGRLRFESNGLPTEAIILGARIGVNTSRLIFKTDGVELRKVPVIRKISMSWEDLTPPNLKFKCSFE